MFKCLNEKGFTLIELLVVIAIISLMTFLVLPNLRFGDRTLALARSSSRLAQDLRRAQNLAISAQEFLGEVPVGYGIYFNLRQPTQYIIFADVDGNKIYSGPSETAETVSLENQIKLVFLAPPSVAGLNIVFNPPDPSIFFTPEDPTGTAQIILEATGTVQIKRVLVNKVGLINVE